MINDKTLEVHHAKEKRRKGKRKLYDKDILLECEGECGCEKSVGVS